MVTYIPDSSLCCLYVYIVILELIAISEALEQIWGVFSRNMTATRTYFVGFEASQSRRF